MRIAGSLLIIVGMIMMLFAIFIYDPTVTSAAVSDFMPSSRTANLQLLVGQLALVLLGGFMFVAGAVFYAGDVIAKAADGH